MVKVLISTDPRYPVNRKIIRKAVADVFEKEGISDINAEVSVSVVGRRKMKDLTAKYLGDGMTHEVLSFPFEDPSTSLRTSPSTTLPTSSSQTRLRGASRTSPSTPLRQAQGRLGQERGFVNTPDDALRLGDVVLSWPEVLLKAANDDVTLDEEVWLLTAHGVEHLLGKHHEENDK